MKKCSKCNIIKELNKFYKHKAMKDGLMSYCIVCTKADAKQWQRDNRVSHNKSLQKWQQNNGEKVKVNSKQWYENNKEVWLKDCRTRQKAIEPGVYRIINLITGKSYIGESVEPYRRNCTHMWIRKKKINDTNEWLQEDLKKYGRKTFVFGIIEHCAKEELEAREQFWINELNPEYNK